jgi:(4-(4-[2-(gamma-L-glutamylamino)ethyl]phenoxymethyl)furan-2-yl)methanamine synthase
MPAEALIGWDIGGAHLKAAALDAQGRLRNAVQLPCALWRGADRLEAALAEALARLGPARWHAVTMTGELVDLFPDRAAGVAALVDCAERRLEGRVLFYAGPSGFVPPAVAGVYAAQIASANWLATACFVARHRPQGVLIDIGSTTTDITVLHEGEPRVCGSDDYARLRLGELVYTGVVRTPAAALARQVPFEGEWRPLVAERFATAADVHRLIGWLPEEMDMEETADGAGKSAAESATRLARMLGRDRSPAPLEAWRGVACHLAAEQIGEIRRALALVLSRAPAADDAPLIGAGAGRFLVRELARLMKRPYVDFADLVAGRAPLREWAAVCAPAVAVARLARAAVIMSGPAAGPATAV